MTSHSVLPRLLATALLLAAALSEGVRTQEAARPSPGDGTLLVGSFAGHFSIIDEATSTIVGKIPFKSGIPRRTSVTRDRTRFYTIEADMDKVEILDIASRSTVDVFSLSQGNKIVRIKTLEPDPKHRFVMMVTRAATRLADRFEIGPAELVQYDLASHTVVRTIPWPNGEERESANIQFSPDGRSMYLFSEQDVLIYDTDTFAQVGKWDMSKAPEDGLGSLRFGATDATNDEPGFYTGLFTVEDPVQHRRMMGIGRVNLSARSVEFSVLGPASQVGFTMSPDRSVAFGLLSEIGRYEFWKFDLAKKQLAERVEFAGRPRMSLKTSSNGRVLYIYNAGATIELYDASTYKFMKTIQLPGDHTTDLFVFPGKAAPTSAF